MSQTDARPTELRLFVSSTFRDLQEEREHLVKKIFPEIRSLCRERGITFTEVDLRWGLTQEDQVLGQVIRTCLEEIDRCRPYFIGITGERYGYVPEITDIYKDPELLRLYPWIEDAAADEMSIIEMEIEHGVLNPNGTAPTEVERENRRAHFYFRRHRASLDDNTPGGDNDDTARLERLQKKVRDAGLPVEEFRDPVSLGELIYDDLVAIIKKDFANLTPPTPLEQEQSRHAAFAASRRHAYIPNTEYLKRLNAWVEEWSVMETEGTGNGEQGSGEGTEMSSTSSSPMSPSTSSPATGSRPTAPPLIIYAESGSGKSSLVSYWAEQYRRRHPEAHVIEHYVGIGAGATDHYNIMRHIMEEIKERFGRSEELPTTPEQIEQQFANWLGFCLKVRDLGEGPGVPVPVVIIIDGINQLQGEGLNLRWMPPSVPANVRLIVTSTVEQTLVELRERGWAQLGMQPLSEKEREAIIVRFLSEYRKALAPDQVKRIAADQKCAHPLFLRTLLEELRLFGVHEKLAGEIDRYLGTTGTEDLFQMVLERIEEDFGARLVRETMSLLWATRSGLSENELQELTDASRLKISSMIMSLDYHLVRRDGLLTFFHDYLRRAVEKRYLADDEKKVKEHKRLADYFEKQINVLIEEDRKKVVQEEG